MRRHHLPVQSPLPVSALGHGIAAAFAPARARAALRRRLAGRYGTDEFLLLDSGTSALALAIRGAARPGETTRVALPIYGCFDLATAALAAGARIRFYDLDPSRLSPDLTSLRAAAEEGVDAVVVAHLYGVPVDLAGVQRALRDTHPPPLLIEDAAQGIGGVLAGRPLGAIGDLGILSFGRGKGMTGGAGGALLANTPRGAATLGGLSVTGRASRGFRLLPGLAAQWVFGRPSLYGVPARMPWLGLGTTPFHPPHRPRPFPAAAYGVLQQTWDPAMDEIPVRQRTGDAWHAALRDIPHLTRVALGEHARPGWLRYPVLLTPALANRVRAEGPPYGIMPGYPRPLDALPDLPVLPSRDAPSGGFRGRALADALFTLPTHLQWSPLERSRALALLRGDRP